MRAQGVLRAAGRAVPLQWRCCWLEERKSAVPHRQGSSESPDGADGCLTLSEVTQVASDHRANTCAALARLSTSPQVPRCPEATPSLPPSFHL